MNGATPSISSEQRATAAHPCPICGGHDRSKRGEGERCYGFLSDDGKWAHCTRDEHAGDLNKNLKSDTYAHRLEGDCKCGVRHGFAPTAEHSSHPRKREGKSRRIVKTYDYQDERGNLLHQTVRYEPKDFSQRQPKPGGGWIWSLKGARLVLYRFPKLLEANQGELTLVCAGEKDADTAADKLGFLATTNPLGEGKWRPEYSEPLRGRPVAIIAHNDEAGRKHAEDVARSLHGKAASVKVVNLPGVPESGGDLTDWTDAGGTPEELKRLIDEAPEWVPPPSREEVAWAACETLAHQKNITAELAKALKRSGVAGESRLLRLLYLALSSRMLDKPVSVAVKGPSSGGKSHAVEKVLKAFPESAYYELTAMSEKALIYLDEDMRHRFLVVFEASGMAGDMQTYLMRTLLSENRIRYQTAESTSQGVKPRLLELEGPTGLIVTTTQTRMHPENETRLLSLTVTDTREQTKDIFRAMAKEDREPVDLKPWRQLQVWLEGQARTASIPYAGKLADMVPPVAVRLRRDFGAVLQLIRAHAVLHQASRGKDGKGRVVATPEDYAVVRELVADLVAEGVDATVSPTVRETVRAVERLTQEDEHVGLKAVANELNIDKASASRRVRAARDAGYLVNLEETKGKPSKLAIGESLPADLVILPEPETLRAEWDRCTVATVQEGRGAGEQNGAGSVADDECNGAQQCNGQGPKPDGNATFDPYTGDVSSHNTSTDGHLAEKQGRGSFDSATLQHSLEEEVKDDFADATQRSAQRSAQRSEGPKVTSVTAARRPLTEEEAQQVQRLITSQGMTGKQARAQVLGKEAGP